MAVFVILTQCAVISCRELKYNGHWSIIVLQGSSGVFLGRFLQHWLLLKVRFLETQNWPHPLPLMGYCCASASPEQVSVASQEMKCEWQGREDLNGAKCWVMLGFQPERGIVGILLYPWFGWMTPHLARSSEKPFGLSDLMALLREFKAGELVQSKWDVQFRFCSICWASVMIYVATCEMKCQKQQQVIFWCRGAKTYLKFFFIHLTTPVIYKSFKENKK